MERGILQKYLSGLENQNYFNWEKLKNNTLIFS
jgi:hypothetical protein